MPIKTIYWDNNAVKLVDQTRLPGELVYIECKTKEDMWHAIKVLQVRGAPAIGIAGGFGVYLGIRDSKTKDPVVFRKELEQVVSYIGSVRPTAVNLHWALARVKNAVVKSKISDIASLKEILLKEAQKILKEDEEICRRIGKYGGKLIKDNSNVLTHCNAGGLATAFYGTALGVLFRAKEDGKKFHVYVDETRPVLQGARLTAWELINAGIDCTIICDNMAASLMKAKKVDIIIVGADRIARNGDTANKIGTYSLACLAHAHKIPFYVAAPISTFDFNMPNGKAIPIEQRNSDEVTHVAGNRIAPDGIKVYNPAFDVTPAKLIKGFITEKGIVKGSIRALKGLGKG